MNTLPNPKSLAMRTLKDPAGAARDLIGLGLPRSALWTALALVASLQALLFGLSTMLFPLDLPMQGVLTTPISFFGLVLIALVLSVYGLVWAGRLMGGEGDLAGVLVLVVWIQMLRVLVQAAALVLTLIMPMLSLLLSLAATIAGIYILLNFVNQVHGLGSLARAFGVLVGAFLIMVFGLSVLLSVIGIPFAESLIHV